jgi:hypothetical protein
MVPFFCQTLRGTSLLSSFDMFPFFLPSLPGELKLLALERSFTDGRKNSFWSKYTCLYRLFLLFPYGTSFCASTFLLKHDLRFFRLT